MKFKKIYRDYLIENYEDELNEAINDEIESRLIYYEDIYRNMCIFASIEDALRGEYSFYDLVEDLYDYILNNDKELADVIKHYFEDSVIKELERLEEE